MILEKCLPNLVLGYNWDFEVEFNYYAEENNDEKFLNAITKNINSYIKKVDWQKERITVSYLIPELFEDYDSVDFIKFFTTDNLTSLQLNFRDSQNNRLFSFQGFVKDMRNGYNKPYYPIDWNLIVNELEPLTLNVTYQISENKVF